MPKMPEPVAARELVTRAEKQEWFDWIRRSALTNWKNQHFAGRTNDDCFRLRDTKLRRPYILRIWGGGYLGFNLEADNSNEVLPINFNFHNSLSETDGRNTAARLYYETSGVYLIHGGRTAANGRRPRPHWGETINVDGRRYFIVAQLGEADFFDEVIAFDETRVLSGPIGEKIADEGKRLGADFGPRKTFSRVGADANPIHGLIVEKLVSRLERLGFEHAEHPHRGPDAFMKRHGRTFLFEVKPSRNFNDLTCALGQLLVYGQETKADRRICVCAKGAWPNARLRGVFESEKIEVVEFSLRGKASLAIDFPDLETRLSA